LSDNPPSWMWSLTAAYCKHDGFGPNKKKTKAQGRAMLAFLKNGHYNCSLSPATPPNTTAPQTTS
jgi:hypothetical protein